MKRKLLVLLLILGLGALAFFFVVPAAFEAYANRARKGPPYAASERARSLQRGLFVADMHADTLLWDRDLLARASRGHVDVPRLQEGGVALQFFTVVSKTPFRPNYESNTERANAITLLGIAERWPARTWTSLKERALYQAHKLDDAAARSGGELTVIRNAGDLARFAERRRGDARAVAGLLGVEGAYVLDGDVNNVDALFDAGFRMMAPTHFFDNEWGGSAHGAEKTGLTDKGREMIRRMEARGMLVDLAHASPRTIDDVLAIATRPVVVSHTGLRGVCDNQRNLSDEHARRIAATGGILAIGFWDAATCGEDARAAARSMRYAANLVGVGHVALGSDFDGTVTEPFDAGGMVEITQALIDEGFSDEDVALIMGGNVRRLLSETLPR
ncbi:MAG TPA: dipeptidase [Pyrinomonadaceae bacterium]|nr:dipeptidase [Pyrinomonadaceae bacterium]